VTDEEVNISMTSIDEYMKKPNSRTFYFYYIEEANGWFWLYDNVNNQRKRGLTKDYKDGSYIK
jgi:hypothetical protein